MIVMVKYNLVIIANWHAYNFINKSNEPAREIAAKHGNINQETEL